MTNQDVINFLNQVRNMLLDDKSWLESTIQPINEAFDKAISALNAPPEIVRCKDCEHRDPEDKKCDSGHSIQWQLPRSDDWFCADAERRTDEWSDKQTRDA